MATKRARARLLAGSAGFLVVAALVGVAAWQVGSGRPALDRAPFTGALAALATAPVAHYRGTLGGIGAVDVRVTAHGELVGTVDDHKGLSEVLDVDGRLFVKPRESALRAPGNPAEAAARKGLWVTGETLAPLRPVTTTFVAPRQLAGVLAAALGSATPGTPTTIGGVAVVAADTRLGTLYVARDEPYRVVRLDPPGIARPAAVLPGLYPGVPTGTEVVAGQPSDVADTYAQLTTKTQELASALDDDLRFTPRGEPRTSCEPAQCDVSVTLDSSVRTPTARNADPARVVKVDLTAVFAYEGRPAGGCSGVGSVPVVGSGRAACSDSATADRMTELLAQDTSADPATAAYTVEYFAYAVADVDIERIVGQQHDESSAVPAPEPAVTLQSTGFRSGAAPDGPTVFGLHDRGTELALDHAAADGQVVVVAIPRADFEQHFRKDVADYGGVADAQVSVPVSELDILDRYPRTTVR